jgi:hypothetical protein
MQFRAMETMVDMHRQDLRVAAGAGRPARRTEHALDETGAAQRSAAGVPVPGGRAVRRAVAPRIGSWLIHAGVRLGGATVRTS